MKLVVTPEQKIAIVLTVIPHPGRSAEQMDARLTAWDDLGVRKFARTLGASGTAAGRISGNMGVKDEQLREFFGTDLSRLEVVDLQSDTVRFLIEELGYDVPGTLVDVVTELRRDLTALRDKRYQLPREVRGAGDSDRDAPAGG